MTCSLFILVLVSTESLAFLLTLLVFLVHFFSLEDVALILRELLATRVGRLGGGLLLLA
jgi:hypothetical protein